MKRSTALSIALIVALHLGIQNGQARSDEVDSVSSSESDATMFMDRDRLVRTLMRDDSRRVDAIRDQRDAAQESLDRAIAEGAPQEVIDELSMDVRRSDRKSVV